MTLGISLSSAQLPDTAPGGFSVALTGLAQGAARPGDHGAIGYVLTPDTGTATVAWGTAQGDASLGTGPHPADFAAHDGGLLWLTASDGAGTRAVSAPIRHAPGTAPALPAQDWTVDDDTVALDVSAAGAGLSFVYGAGGLPPGLALDAGTGVIAGTPTSPGTGTVSLTATDQYGRALAYGLDWSAAPRPQAVAAGALSDRAWTVADEVVDLDLAGDVTPLGNSLYYGVSGLPDGLSDDGDGTISGTPATQGQSGTVTLTATDEYGRETVSAFGFTTALRAPASAAQGLGPFDFAEGTAIAAQDLSADFSAHGNTLGFAMLTALPAGLSVSPAGSMTGTPSDPIAPAGYTLRATDEYGRTTDSTFSVAVSAAPPVGGIATPDPVTLDSAGPAQVSVTLPADPAATGVTIDDRVVALVPLAAYAGHEQDPAAWTAGGAQYMGGLAAGATHVFSGSYSGDYVATWEARDTTTDPRTDSDWAAGVAVNVAVPAFPPTGLVVVGAQQGDGSVPLTITDPSEDATDCTFVFVPAGEPAPSTAQVRAGQRSNGTAAPVSGGFSVTASSPNATLSGLPDVDGNFDVHVVLGDAEGDFSAAPIDAGAVTLDFTPDLPPRLIDAQRAGFATGQGWEADPSWSISGGELVVTASSGILMQTALAANFQTGRAYAAYADVTALTGGTVTLRAEGGANLQAAASGGGPRHVIRRMVATADHNQFGINFNAFTGTVGEVQVHDIEAMETGPLDIYILAGQSNMAGASATTGFDLAIDTPEWRALCMPATTQTAFGFATDGTGASINAALSSSEGVGALRPLCEPTTMASQNIGGVSPARSIATALADSVAAGRTPLLVCVAEGGTDFFTRWSGAGDPNYDLMVANVNAALALNGENAVAGLFWCQGESSTPTGYAAAFNTMIGGLRTAWGAFPVVVMEHGGLRGDAGFDTMRAEQQKLATGSGDAAELAWCSYLDRPAGAALEADNVHYTGTTNRTRGTEAAAEMLNLIAAGVPSSSSAAFEGDATGTAFGTSLTLDSNSPSQTPLPAVFTAGRKLVAVNEGDGETVTGVTIDGVAATPRGSSGWLSFWEADIAGNTTNAIGVQTGGDGTNRVTVAMWDVTGKTFQSSATSTPADTNPRTATTQFDTGPGDVLVGAWWSVDTAATYTAGTGATLRTDDLGNNGRFLVTLDSLNASGGSPEDFALTASAGFTGATLLAVHYA